MDTEDHSSVMAQFCGITDAPPHVAENYLEAMEWQLERAIDFYMEHPPNHEPGPYEPDQPAAAQPDAIEIPDDDEDQGMGVGISQLAQQRASRLAARRAAEAAEWEGDLAHGGLQVHGTGLGAGPGPASAAAAAAGVAGSSRFPAAAAAPGTAQPPNLMGFDDGDADAIAAAVTAGMAGTGGTGGGGGGDEGIISSFHRRQQEQLLAHYQQQARQQQAAAFRQLGAAEGLDEEDREAAEAAAAAADAADAAAGAGAGAVMAAGAGEVPLDMDLDLPEGINIEEARMLEAAMLGVPYQGRLPDLSGARAAAAPLPPGTREQRALREEQDAAYEESLALDRAKQASVAAAEAEAQIAAFREQQEAQAAAQAAEEARQQLAALLAAKRQRLPPEPAGGEPGVLQIMVRLPDGSRKGRRFRATDPLQAVFDYVDVQCAGDSGAADAAAAAAAEAAPGCGIKPGGYRLVMQFPRKVFNEGSEGSLQEAGIAADSALFVESLA